MLQNCSPTKAQVKLQYDSGWSAALNGVRKVIKAHREDHGVHPDTEQILAYLIKLEGMPDDC